MKIVLDNLIFSWQKLGGISVFWSKIVDLVIRRIPTEKALFLEYPFPTANIVRQQLSLPPSRLHLLPRFCFTLQRYLNLSLSFLREPFIFHSSYYRICTNPNAVNIITVHDFTYEKYTSGLTRFVHVFQKHRALKKADFIVCISENTRQDLFRHLPGLRPEKVGVIHNGVNENYRPLSDEELSTSLSLPPHFLLFVGSRAPYKQFDFSAQVAHAAGLPLLVVGAPLSPEEQQRLQHLDVKYIGKPFATDEELCRYYNQATALLYPSEYEGFGIPVIEAQRCGCPVIALNASSIPEVIGQYPLLLDRLSVERAATLIQRLLHDSDFREDVRKLGIDNSRRFSWEKMQDQYLALYQQLWENRFS